MAPKWSRTPVAAVVYSDAQAWISELAQRRGAKVVRGAQTVLYGILEDAVRDRRIASNPGAQGEAPTDRETAQRLPHRGSSYTR
ncbi:hypothetical protein [Mycolicibacterium brisbanense]|uniref:hypothetical protein n=1 Tax=Mycolicibacterium brisbanense TaxID=146020 RepID=UPI000A5CF1B2|nr:hypothetical protein [Mycolicibacterium brisbanense]